jgi:hypothetical protein
MTCDCKAGDICKLSGHVVNGPTYTLCNAGKFSPEYIVEATKQQAKFRKGQTKIGTALKSIIARELPGAMACNTCREQIARLNKMSPEAVLADIDSIVSDIFSRSETEAPKLWQRMAVRLDKAAHEALPAVHLATMKMLHGEPIDTTETEYRIKMWVQEAAETVASNRPQKKNQPEHEFHDFHELST